MSASRTIRRRDIKNKTEVLSLYFAVDHLHCVWGGGEGGGGGKKGGKGTCVMRMCDF
jgi:hypothetical protein